jgi:anti-sigma B factor antagonist
VLTPTDPVPAEESKPDTAPGPTPSDRQIQVRAERVEPDVMVFRVAGEIDLLTAGVLSERLREEIDHGDRAMVIDLTEVSFLGSAGLSEIVAAARAGADNGMAVCLVATNRAVLRPLEVTGLLSLFTVVNTVEAALRECAADGPAA